MNILLFGNSSLLRFDEEKKIASALAKRGHKIYIVSNIRYKPKHKNIHVIKIHFSEYKSNLIDIKDRIDAVLGIDQSVSAFVSEYKHRRNIKSYCLFLSFPSHEIDGTSNIHYRPDFSQKFYYWLNCSLELDGVIFNSKKFQEEYKKKYRRNSFYSKVSFLSENLINSFDEKFFSKEDYIFGCYKLVSKKNLDVFLTDLRHMPYNYKHAYSIYDEKYLELIKAYAKTIDNNIVLYRNPTEEEKYSLIYKAKMIAYPACNVLSFGKVVIEGMALKTPSVVNDSDIQREMYGEGVLFAKSKKDFADKTISLCEDKEFNKKLAEAGYDMFCKELSIERTVERIEDILKNG